MRFSFRLFKAAGDNMKKTWLIFRNEYLKHILTRRFLFALISIPLFVILLIGVGYISVLLQIKKEPIGYLDQSGWLQNQSFATGTSNFPFPSIKIIPYSDESQGRADVQSGILQAFYILDSDYLHNGQVTLVAKEQPGENAQGAFNTFLRRNLLANQPKEISQRLLQGSTISVRSADGSRQQKSASIFSFLLPFINGLLLVVVIAISGSYLLRAMMEEKENRIMEILITSVSPNQLMTAKVIANLLVGLTQLMVWLIFAILGLLAAQNVFHFNAISALNAGQIGLMIAIMLPAFVMIAALMTAVGATFTEPREAQQISSLFILPLVAPYWFIYILMTYPNSPISVFLSLFPLTSPVSMPLRAVFTVVPAWQAILTIALLVIGAIGALWLAGKVFRLGMLNYGKRLTLREIFRRSTRESEG